MVTEDRIQECIEELSEQPMVFEQHLQEWMEWQPHIASYLFSESFSLLNEVEKEAFVFGATAIMTIAEEDDRDRPTYDDEIIGEREEANYEILEEQGASSIKNKMDAFFKDYPEEELLAFIEDLCVHEDDEDFTKDGVEVMVVGLKTVVDVLFL